MKIILFAIHIVLVLHISTGASISHEDPEVEQTKNSLQLINEFIDKLGPMIKAAIADIPRTDAYGSYKQELQKFVRFYDDNRKSNQVCLDKSFNALKEFFILIQGFEADPNASIEKIEVRNIMRRHGINDLCTQYDLDVDKAEDPTMDELLKEC